MNQLTKIVIPVFAVNAILSLLGFALFMARFGTPEVLIHPLMGAVWTLLLFAQMVLAAKQHPAHRVVGRIALVVLFVSVYAALRGVAMHASNPESPIPVTVLFLFVVTGVAFVAYAAMGVAFVINRQFEAHSTAMLLAGAVSMAAGVSRAAGAFDAMAGIPFQLTYALSALSMAAALWVWRPSQRYLVGSYVVMMGCVIFLR
jgi:hypothetical protein